MKRYYFDEKDENNYATLWNGFLEFSNNNNIEISDMEVNDIMTEVCDINFYIYVNNTKIFFSLCQDSKYYYHQFEKDILNSIKKIENKFNICILNGEFNAVEIKHNGCQYKYNILKDNDSKFVLKKKILSWQNIKKKKIDDINDKLENLKI